MIFSEYFCVFCPPRQPFRTVSDVFFAPFPLSICPRCLFLSLRTFVCSRLPRPVPPFFVLCAVRRSLSSRIPSSSTLPRRPLRVPFSFVILPSATSRGVPCRACLLCRLLVLILPFLVSPSSLCALRRSSFRDRSSIAVRPRPSRIWFARRRNNDIPRADLIFDGKKVPRRKLFGELCSVHVTVKYLRYCVITSIVAIVRDAASTPRPIE